jgi:hypothetical protein
LSDALALTCTVALTVAPLLGAVIDTAGAVVSGVLFATVTCTEADVVLFPAASRATAVSVCDPFVAVVVFHETAYGADVSSTARADPSR